MLRQLGHWIQQNRSVPRFQALLLTPTTTFSRAMSQNALDAFLQKRTLPPFKRIEIPHLEKALHNVLDKTREDLKALEAKLDHKLNSEGKIEWEDIVDPLEIHSDALDRLWGLVGHLMSVKNNDEIRNVHDQFEGPVTETITSMSQSRQLYRSFMELSNSATASKMDPGHARLIELSIRGAKFGGVGLEEKLQEEFNQLKVRSTKKSTNFSTNVLDATKAYALTLTTAEEIEGLSSSLLEMFAESARKAGVEDATAAKGPWRVTLDPPSYTQFIKNASNRSSRETLQRAYASRASHSPYDNRENIDDLLKIRDRMAKLLGYSTYAELSIAKKMAPSVEQVEKMHEDLRERCLPIARKEIQQLEEFACSRGQKEPLASWDVAYWTEQLKSARYQFNDDEIKPYFPLESVLKGLFELTSKLYGVSIKAADGQAETWHVDVRFFHVYDKTTDKHIASFFLDPYSRPAEKNGGAWMNVCVNRSKLLAEISNGNGAHVPVAYLICNQSPPINKQPSLMTFREVETLFHEFGHGLQHMLTTVDYSSIAGINGIEWDAVELPSQMMENFCYDHDTLASVSGHYETGEPLPANLFEKICAARYHMAATMMLAQLSYGALDLYLHHHKMDGIDAIFQAQDRILKEFCVTPLLENNRFLCAFSHIFAGGYAAGYYSYKWAEVLSCDAYEAFNEAKQLDDEGAIVHVGRRFRDTILSLGGGCHPMKAFTLFRGREPSIEPLLRQYGLLKSTD
uniref:oligopeptidase A n=1 Tax=Albugo laibachii Nc14 TaxID=890382 RepID=F0W2F4_9STRA|nr:oligopeptidase A putative [Albugo laibachii Nc14]|eukprot:CCA15240.1 oligopeptidase A putative [Albugo laibachii Nc14]